MTKITLTFETCGNYHFENMRVSCLPSEKVLSAAKALKNTVSDIAVFKNSISCKTDFDREKNGCVRRSVSSGWTAYIDGEEAGKFSMRT